MSEESSDKNFLGGLLIGAIIGVGIATVLSDTPKGKQLRSMLRKKAQDLISDLPKFPISDSDLKDSS